MAAGCSLNDPRCLNDPRGCVEKPTIWWKESAPTRPPEAVAAAAVVVVLSTADVGGLPCTKGV
jgi:hypothetical protein